MEADISIWQKPGHFYFALTRAAHEDQLFNCRLEPHHPAGTQTTTTVTLTIQ
jgi:hypothetical protein